MFGEQGLLGGSRVWAITIVILLITPRITTHEPPSRVRGFEGLGFEPGCRSRIFLDPFWAGHQP